MNVELASSTPQPNPPLRKPLSSRSLPPSTLLPNTPTFPPGTLKMPTQGDGPINGPAISNEPLPGTSPSSTVYFCNYCAQRGTFRCNSCKQTLYCSVVCQTKDWAAHRYMCKYNSLDLSKQSENQLETTGLSVIGNQVPHRENQVCDSANPQRVLLSELGVPKVVKDSVGQFQASVTEFYSPARFFLLSQNHNILEVIQTIGTKLNDPTVQPPTSYIPCAGEVCAVLFSFDLKWYRGVVRYMTTDQKMANVLYIDYGNEESVPWTNIRPLPPSVQTFPPCAMECRIADVVPVKGDWSVQCNTIVKNLLAGNIVTVKLGEAPENNHVLAVDVILSNGQFLSSILLEQGYATKERTKLAPKENNTCAMVNASLENFRCLSDGKDDNNWALPPEPLTQAVGDQFSVVVTHFQSVNQIIVQKVKNAGVIQDLQSKLRDHCSVVTAPHNFRPAPGTVCCALFSEDKQWYRAKVLAYPSEKRVCVGYLDFGNSEEVDLSDLRPISAALLALPSQAIPCGLAGVQPVGEKWSEDSLLALRRRVSNRFLRISIQGAHEGVALVKMVDEASDPQADVAELLISAGYANSIPIPIAALSPNKIESTNKAAEPQVPVPVSEPLVWSNVELPCNGQMVVLHISFVESPGKFYCRIYSPSERQRLVELEAQLKLHCKTDSFVFTPKVGEPCCAMSSENGSWHRAIVKELLEDKAKINFVDSGHSTVVELRKLHSITPKLLELPFQAVSCFLAGVEPLGSEWSSEAILTFQTLVDGKQVSAKVHDITEQGYAVELENRGAKVAATLISQQLVKASGETSKETHLPSVTKQLETVEENGLEQVCVQTPNKMENDFIKGNEGPTGAPSQVLPFPVDWKTAELPVNLIFQPYFVGVTSPAHFYVFNTTPLNHQILQQVMMDLASHCSSTTFSGNTRPAPGSACCAQFSVDNGWYRAVVLEVYENDCTIIYADYGNKEKVPYSKILPITPHLLQFNFQIVRCTLAGRELLPPEWSEEAEQMFETELGNGVVATVEGFDGFSNVLSLVLPPERGGGQLTTILSDALKAKSRNSQSSPDDPGNVTPASPAVDVNLPQANQTDKPQNHQETGDGGKPLPEPATRQNIDTNTAAAAYTVKNIDIDQMEVPCQNQTNDNGPQSPTCCCQNLTTKIDTLEQMIQLQLKLIKKFVGEVEYC